MRGAGCVRDGITSIPAPVFTSVPSPMAVAAASAPPSTETVAFVASVTTAAGAAGGVTSFHFASNQLDTDTRSASDSRFVKSSISQMYSPPARLPPPVCFVLVGPNIGL